ncbi:hypothetical protein CHUAL_013395 [Chamberlinius hualienensis]
MKIYGLVFLIATGAVHLLTSAEINNDSGFCHISVGDGNGKCKQEGKYKVGSLSECCDNGAAAGYSTNTSGFKAIKDFFLKRKETTCQSCADSFDKNKKWCFTYRNHVDGFCVHIPYSSTLETSNEFDCSLWWNATGYTESPKWKWSNSYSRWVTPCNKLVRNKLVACFLTFIDVSGGRCGNFLPKYTESPDKCCSQPNVTGYAWIEPNNRAMAGCNACPVHGGWSQWSAWSPCSTTCGHSVRRRLRECNNPKPKFGGSKCSENSEETEKCDVILNCPESENTITTALTGRINDNWSQWSLFSPCSVTCGSGIMERKRTCPNAYANCKGASHEVTRCNAPLECLNVGVNWIWTEWSHCHQTCGAGVRLRSKLCLIVGQAVGSQCSTEANVEMDNCDLPSCNSTILDRNPQLRVQEPAASVTPWVIPIVILSILLSSLVFVFVYKRKAIISKRKKKLTKLGHLRRPLDKRLPSLPPCDPSDGYVPMTVINQSFPAGVTTKCECGGTKCGCGRHIDKDGYEIPKDVEISPKTFENIYDSDATVDHVYEQLTFYQDLADCLSAPTDVPENVEKINAG